jgi:hypothetical protein
MRATEKLPIYMADMNVDPVEFVATGGHGASTQEPGTKTGAVLASSRLEGGYSVTIPRSYIELALKSWDQKSELDPVLQQQL